MSKSLFQVLPVVEYTTENEIRQQMKREGQPIQDTTASVAASVGLERGKTLKEKKRAPGAEELNAIVENLNFLNGNMEQNYKIYAELRGKTVKFLETILLYHIYSGKFLAAKKHTLGDHMLDEEGVASNDEGESHYSFHLSPYVSKKTLFSFHEYSRFQRVSVVH